MTSQIDQSKNPEPAHGGPTQSGAVPEQSGHAGRVRDQFSRQAGEYAVSVPHSSGESLDILQRLAAETRHRWAVDVATGAGFTAFAVAPYAERVLATDIAPGMIRVTRDAAAERGLDNVSAVFSAAENLPFRSGTIDLVTCRTAPHHFHRLDDAIHEIARVIRPGGAFLLVDTCTSEDPEVAAWQQVIEVRRDPTHVRNLPPSEWRSLIESAGLTIDFETLARVEMTFDGWTQRSGTPAEVCEELRIEWRTAPPAAVSAFRIIPIDGGNFHFSWPVYVCRAMKSAQPGPDSA